MSRFVPSRIPHLIEELAARLPEGDRSNFWALARILEAFYHHGAGAQTRTAEALYSPYDPDRETVPPPSPTGEDPLGRLYDWLGGLFEPTYGWLRDLEPIETIGHTIHIYDIPPEAREHP